MRGRLDRGVGAADAAAAALTYEEGRGAVVAASSCEEVPLGLETTEAGAAASGPGLRGYEAGKDGIVAVTDWPACYPEWMRHPVNRVMAEYAFVELHIYLL